MTIKIPLSINSERAGVHETLIDDADAILADINWSYNGNYAIAKSRNEPEKRKSLSLHRMVMERFLERPLEKGESVDHINGNKLDNRRENLRLANISQNAMNKGLQSNNKSGYKGVSWDKQKGKWQARIGYKGKIYNLGNFDKPEDAYEAYKAKAIELHGEFANFGGNQ